MQGTAVDPPCSTPPRKGGSKTLPNFEASHAEVATPPARLKSDSNYSFRVTCKLKLIGCFSAKEMGTVSRAGER